MPDFVGVREGWGEDPRSVRKAMTQFVPLAVNALVYTMYNAEYFRDRNEAAKILIEHAIGKAPQAGIDKEVQTLAWEKLVNSIVNSEDGEEKKDKQPVPQKKTRVVLTRTVHHKDQ